MKKTKLLTAKKNHSDAIAKAITLVFVIFFITMFVGVIAFIIYASIPGWKTYGFKNIFLTATFNLQNGQASVWMALCVTMMVAGLALLIGGPVGIKTATFIKFRVSDKYRRYVKMVVEFLSNIPSVVFGLFTITALGPLLKTIFHMPTAYNLINTGIMLGFMIMPTVVSLNLSALDSVDKNFLVAPILMGNTKTAAIYKVYKKQIRGKVVVSLISGIARALGETMAVSMILQSQSYNQVFDTGFGGVWLSYLKTLGGVISSNMNAEMATQQLKGLLFVYGLFLFVFVMVLNGVTKAIFRQRNTTSRGKVLTFLGNVIMFIPRKIVVLWNKILNKNVVVVTPANYNSTLAKYYQQRAFKSKSASTAYDVWKIFWEVFCFTLLYAFIAWMFVTLIIKGILACMAPSQTVFQFTKNTTGQALVNTLLIILVGVGIGFIIALAVAIYLNEFAKEGKFKKGLIFFIDTLGATPSIIYGMFGMIFFIQILGLTSAGSAGKSIMAGALTIIFVILPAFTRTLLQALQSIPNQVRNASYALGVGKWATCRKIVLPACLQHILTAVVLSIGRVLAETAPLYLTAGLGGGSKIGFMSPGQTLTTRIYAQVNSNNIADAKNIMYECAFVTLVMILIILLVVNVIIPKVFEHKKKKASIPIQIKEKKKKSFKQKVNNIGNKLFTKAKVVYNFNF